MNFTNPRCYGNGLMFAKDVVWFKNGWTKSSSISQLRYKSIKSIDIRHKKTYSVIFIHCKNTHTRQVNFDNKNVAIDAYKYFNYMLGQYLNVNDEDIKSVDPIAPDPELVEMKDKSNTEVIKYEININIKII